MTVCVYSLLQKSAISSCYLRDFLGMVEVKQVESRLNPFSPGRGDIAPSSLEHQEQDKRASCYADVRSNGAGEVVEGQEAEFNPENPEI